ncbi:hypothetical protein CHH79_00800 [Bacillus siamensis]|uniref:helix-turn-helix domain-containing protein n=1 Tax=Bacillus siamensis TaxID=659243 RepID=UPI000BA7971C|nr:RodZ domain-containing protein [Bacillus siamensis]PAD65541.1 hypothetical protein CHH79_00800 [Bacillus siamensis]
MTELAIRLKEAREEKGMSLDELQAATKIQKRYLTALEEGSYDVIPGNFYVRAFIKQYAEAVGLDSDQLFEEYKKDIPNTYHDDVSEKISGLAMQRELPKSSKAAEWLPTVLIVIGVIIVIAIVYAIIQFGISKSGQTDSNKAVTQSESKYEIPKDSALKNDGNTNDGAHTDSKKDKKAPEQKKKEKSSEKTEIKAAGTEGSASSYNVSGADKYKLELIASDNAWIRVRDDSGGSLKEGTLQKGETYKKDITDQKQIEIRTGYAPNLKIKINGEVLSYELNPHDVMAQTITIKMKK